MPFFDKEARYAPLNSTTLDEGSLEQAPTFNDGVALQHKHHCSTWAMLVHGFLGVIWVLGFLFLLDRSYHLNSTMPDANSTCDSFSSK